MIGKNYPFPQLLWYGPLILAYELLSIGYAMWTGRGSIALSGRMEGLRQLPRVLAKRRQLVRKVSSQAMMARLQPVENPLTLLHRHLSIAKTVSSQYK
jgi:hypothetical protein